MYKTADSVGNTPHPQKEHDVAHGGCPISEHLVEQEWEFELLTLVCGLRGYLGRDETRVGTAGDRISDTFKPLKRTFPVGSGFEAFALLCLVPYGKGFGNKLEPRPGMFDGP